jgi:ribosome-associated protein
LRNRQAALERFIRLLREALHRPRPRRPTRKPRRAKEERLRRKKQRGQLKKGRSNVAPDNS